MPAFDDDWSAPCLGRRHYGYFVSAYSQKCKWCPAVRFVKR
jgi:hypothetical protein